VKLQFRGSIFPNAHTFMNTVLKVRAFAPKKEERTVGSKKLHVEDHNLYYLTCVVERTKSRRVRWMRHVARMVGIGKLKEITCRKSKRKEIMSFKTDVK
jgi:hypothetical protein